MSDDSFCKKITCPWCERGEVLGTTKTEGIVSIEYGGAVGHPEAEALYSWGGKT